MRRPKTFVICCVILLAIVASGVIIPWVKREQTLKQIKEQHEAELEILAAYPWIDEIDPDNIAKLTTCEGDIVYTVTDKEAIAEIMGIIRDANPQPVIINPEDDKGRPAGGPKNALWLDITTKDDKESWSLTIDDENFPADFVIDHTVYKNKDTGWSETTTGYFTKPDKIYRQIKAIMYDGERVDLNEFYNRAENAVHVTSELNPDLIYEKKEVTSLEEEGYIVTDFFLKDDVFYFGRYKDELIKTPEHAYTDEYLAQKYSWGYVDKESGNKTVFDFESDDEEYPYASIFAMIGRYGDRVYAFTARSKVINPEEKIPEFASKYYLTSFTPDGKVAAEVEYTYSLMYEIRDDSFVTPEGTIAVFNGALTLYDGDFNQVALVTDKRLSKVYLRNDGNISAFLTDLNDKKHVVYSSKDLSVVSKETLPVDYRNEDIIGLFNDSALLMIKRFDDGEAKLVSLDLKTCDETEIMDLNRSGVDLRDLRELLFTDGEKRFAVKLINEKNIGEATYAEYIKGDK